MEPTLTKSTSKKTTWTQWKYNNHALLGKDPFLMHFDLILETIRTKILSKFYQKRIHNPSTHQCENRIEQRSNNNTTWTTSKFQSCATEANSHYWKTWFLERLTSQNLSSRQHAVRIYKRHAFTKRTWKYCKDMKMLPKSIPKSIRNQSKLDAWKRDPRITEKGPRGVITFCRSRHPLFTNQHTTIYYMYICGTRRLDA